MVSQNLSPELAELRQAYASGVAAKTILDDFASRTNNQRVTKVDQILNRLRSDSVQRWNVIALFRKLEELGHGRFVEGRKGHPSRFVWSSNPIEVGRAAQGSEAPIMSVPISSPGNEELAEMREYVFPLRAGTDATFQLPTNLTLKEAQRLSAFLQTLAIPE